MTKPRRGPARPYNNSAWTPAELAELHRLVAEGLCKAQICRSFPGRSPEAVQGRLTALALTPARLTPEQRRAVNKQNVASQRTPPEKLATIRRLASSRISASKIADRLGTTKNAVIGLCRTHKIPLHGSRGKRQPKRTAENAVAVRSVAPAQATPQFVKDGKVAHPSLPPSLPSVAAVSLADIEHSQCRYIGERPEIITVDTPIFCGRAGYPYCPVHQARCYLSARPRAALDLTRLVRQL